MEGCLGGLRPVTLSAQSTSQGYYEDKIEKRKTTQVALHYQWVDRWDINEENK